jgi:hypothetical protein
MELIVEKRVKLGRFIVRVDRVRKGKIQRRKLRSIRKNYKMRGKRLVRMKTSEIRKRRISRFRAVRKRMRKMAQILRKRKISIRKGKSAGLYK